MTYNSILRANKAVGDFMRKSLENGEQVTTQKAVKVFLDRSRLRNFGLSKEDIELIEFVYKIDPKKHSINAVEEYYIQRLDSFTGCSPRDALIAKGLSKKKKKHNLIYWWLSFTKVSSLFKERVSQAVR